MRQYKKRVLIFIDWFTPGFKAGGPVSSNVNMIAHLAEDFNFKVVTRNTEYTEDIPYPDILAGTWIQKDGYEGYYINKQNLKISTFFNLFRNTSYDVVYINGIYSWFFSLLPLILAKRNKKKVLVASRGMLSAHSLGVKSFKKNIFVSLARLTRFYHGVTFQATNEDELVVLKKLFGDKILVKVAPNLPRKMAGNFPERTKVHKEVKMISIARISPEKNTLYALEILREFGKASGCEDTKVFFDLYGPVYNEAYWAQCLEIINSFPKNIIFSYKGSVSPAELPDKLNSAHFLFFPTRGENFGHTILESFQYGCPVIISDCTPWRSLEEKSVGWDIPLEQPQKFVEVIEHCAAMDQEEYDAMSRLAFEYAKQVTEDPAVLEANRRLFD